MIKNSLDQKKNKFRNIKGSERKEKNLIQKWNLQKLYYSINILEGNIFGKKDEEDLVIYI